MISIRDSKVEELARTLAEIEHVSITKAIRLALEERTARIASLQTSKTARDKAALAKIQSKAMQLSKIDHRSEDDILGYGPTGTFEDS